MIKTGNIILIVTLSIIFLLCVLTEEIRDFRLLNSTGKQTHCHNTESKNSNITNESEKPCSAVSYKYDPADKKLILSYSNIALKRCAENMLFEVLITKDTIRILEREIAKACSQASLSNFEIELDTINARTYRIEFIKPDQSKQTDLCFLANLSDSANGLFYMEHN